MVKKKLKTHLPHQTDFHRIHFLALIVMALGVIFISVATYQSSQQTTAPSRVMERYVITKMYNIIEERNAMMVRAGSMILLMEKEELGSFLIDQNKMTLYTFKDDDVDLATCFDECAKNWPFLWTKGQIAIGEGINGELGITDRPDGPGQVTYNNQPLYYYINDHGPGEANGHGLNDKWSVARP